MESTINRYHWLLALDILGILIASLFSFFLNYPIRGRLIFLIATIMSQIISIHFMSYLFIKNRRQQSNSKFGQRVAIIVDVLSTFIFFSFQSVKLPDYLQVLWTISYLVCIAGFFITIYFCTYWIARWFEFNCMKK